MRARFGLQWEFVLGALEAVMHLSFNKSADKCIHAASGAQKKILCSVHSTLTRSVWVSPA